MINMRTTAKKYAALWLALGSFALAVIAVNPIRETAMEDDWAYALTVQQLLDTGNYQLHEWAAANMPFQIYWGALFAKIGGLSFTTLRFSTLVLTLAGLLAFYFLAKEHGLDDTQAGLIVLCLLASPLVLRFSFTFMTDVPFLAGLIIALLFYTRAIRSQSYAQMLLASIAASAAILTRQFGVAIVAGVFFLWILGKDRKAQLPFLLVGITLPSVAGIWQVVAGALDSTWGARINVVGQADYLANPDVVFANVLFRPAVFLELLAIFALPLVVMAGLALVLDAKRKWLHPNGRNQVMLVTALLGALSLYLLAGIAYWRSGDHLLWFSSFVRLAWTLPYVPWNFQWLADVDKQWRILASFFTSVGAILFAHVFIRRYFGDRGWRTIPPSERLLDLVTLSLLVLQLLFFNVLDEYLLVLLPFTLIVIGRYLGTLLNRFRVVMVVACLFVLIPSALWTHVLLASEEAAWTAGEITRAEVEFDQIGAPWTWTSFHAFDDYLRDIDPWMPASYAEFELDFYARWIPERRRSAALLITYSPQAPSGEATEIVMEIPYVDIPFLKRSVYVLKKTPQDNPAELSLSRSVYE